MRDRTTAINMCMCLFCIAALPEKTVLVTWSLDGSWGLLSLFLSLLSLCLASSLLSLFFASSSSSCFLFFFFFSLSLYLVSSLVSWVILKLIIMIIMILIITIVTFSSSLALFLLFSLSLLYIIDYCYYVSRVLAPYFLYSRKKGKTLIAQEPWIILNEFISL